MVKDMRGICVSRFAPQISPLIQDGMFQLGCHVLRTCSICYEDMIPEHHDVAELPCKHHFHHECVGRWLGMGKPHCPLCWHHLAWLGVRENCRVVAMAGWCSFSIAGARDEEFFCAQMHLVWQDEWWVSDACRKKTGPKHSFKTSQPNILLAIWRVTFATATLAFQGWTPYLNKSIDMF